MANYDPNWYPTFKDSLLGNVAKDSWEVAKDFAETGIWNTDIVGNRFVREGLQDQIDADSRSIKVARWLKDANKQRYLQGALASAKDIEDRWSLKPWSKGFAGKKSVRRDTGGKAIGAYNALGNWERQQMFGDAGVDPYAPRPTWRDAPVDNIWWLTDEQKGG
jgi:hypothetical protein